MSTFEETLVEQTRSDAGDIFGAIVDAFDKNGRSFLAQAAGRQSWSSDDPLDPNSTYWGFSFTKLFTTISALQCVERRQIGLDDDLYGVLPELKDLQVIALFESPTDDAQPTFSFAPAKQKITLRRLLTHTSGIGYDGLNPKLQAWRKSRGETTMFFSGKVVEAYSAPLIYQPGDGWAYGGGLDWVGTLIERLNKTTLGDYMEKNIFQPLGLKSSTFEITQRPDLEARLLQMSFRTPEGGLKEGQCSLPTSPSEQSGGVGLISSLSDHKAVLLDILSDAPTILSKASVKEMFTPQLKQGSSQHKDLQSFIWFWGNLTGALTDTSSINFGLGGLLIEGATTNLPAETLTWGAMPGMMWFANRSRGVGGVFVTQLLPPGDAKTSELMGEFAKAAFAKG